MLLPFVTPEQYVSETISKFMDVQLSGSTHWSLNAVLDAEVHLKLLFEMTDKIPQREFIEKCLIHLKEKHKS
jgi:hypothetical protein